MKCRYILICNEGTRDVSMAVKQKGSVSKKSKVRRNVSRLKKLSGR
jgi:hypothetical protein